MNTTRVSFLFIITLILAVLDSQPFLFAETLSFTGKVVGILDGDTIEVLHNGQAERIRLNGIDCPEKKQPFGRRAKQATSVLSFSQHVTVNSAGKDRYGRILGSVELADGTNLNYALIQQGWCWWYWRYAPDEPFLAVLEIQAREAKKGLWVDPTPVPPWEWRTRGQKRKLF